MPMRIDTAVGHTIQSLRLEQDLTLRELSNKSFISLGYLCEIENCRKQPSYEIQQKIAEALNITSAELYRQIYLYLANSEKSHKTSSC